MRGSGETPVAQRAPKDQITPMINRRTTVLTGLVTGLSLGLARTMPARAQAQLTAQDRADLGKIEDYLNGIHSLKASFAQTAPDGNVTHGVTIMQRPGRMRVAGFSFTSGRTGTGRSR